MVSISACHAEDPGSIPGGGVWLSLRDVLDARGAIASVLLRRVTCADEVGKNRQMDSHEHM